MRYALILALLIVLAPAAAMADRWDRGGSRGHSGGRDYGSRDHGSSRWDRDYKYDRGDRYSHHHRSHSKSGFGFSFGFGSSGYRGYDEFAYRYGVVHRIGPYNHAPVVYRDPCSTTRYYSAPVVVRPAPRVYYSNPCPPRYYNGTSFGVYYYRK